MIGHCAYNVKLTIANKSVVQQKHQIRKAQNTNLQTGNYFFPQKIKKIGDASKFYNFSHFARG